jgi:hypothetical protein
MVSVLVMIAVNVILVILENFVIYIHVMGLILTILLYVTKKENVLDLTNVNVIIPYIMELIVMIQQI